MTDRITTACQHSHTVTLRLDEGEWGNVTLIRRSIHTHLLTFTFTENGDNPWLWYADERNECPRAIRAELEAALAAAEASCGGCGCAERLRAEARDLAAVAQECIETGNERVAKIADAKSVGHFCAADFLDAAPDARGCPEWNAPKEMKR